jgi:hypothetical protein
MADTIDSILDIELPMFLALNPSNEAPCHTHCQDHPETFRMIRRASFETWSQDTLNAYHFDLLGAYFSIPQRNVLFEKYARMSGEFQDAHINQEKQNNIDEILEIERNWYEDFAKEHPGILRKQDNFSMRYLRGELETYSSRTINLYLKDRKKAVEENRNLVEETHKNLNRLKNGAPAVELTSLFNI